MIDPGLPAVLLIGTSLVLLVLMCVAETRSMLLALGGLLLLFASAGLAWAAFCDWFFRDGLGPDSTVSSGALAWIRFWGSFRYSVAVFSGQVAAAVACWRWRSSRRLRLVPGDHDRILGK